MELKDADVDNMSLEDWTKSIHSEVHSSYNLHQLLPHDITFFTLLSSIAGIVGSAAQINYAASNTCQGTPVQDHHTLGLKATSIDLGWMGDVTAVAD